jgi:mannose-6-phosphate isomerase-like protein (cupin superfamily)
MTLAEFMAQGETSSPAPPSATPAIITARRSLTANGASVRVSTPNYDYEYLCADLREKRMVPIITRIRAHSIGEFGDQVRHRGEEFVYVLEGSVEVHLQFYAPVVLRQGEGLYVDSTMGHAYIAKDCDTALILAVCSSEDVDLAEDLISQAEGEASFKS